MRKNKYMQQETSYEKAIIISDYRLGSWMLFIILFSGILIGFILSSNTLSNSEVWILISVSLFIVIFLSSYLFLNQIKFYTNKIEICYLIKHASQKVRTIELKNVNAFRYIYIGGTGSGGNGELKVYYLELGHNKILKCPMNKHSAAKVLLKMKEQGIKIEINPSDVLSEYGL